MGEGVRRVEKERSRREENCHEGRKSGNENKIKVCGCRGGRGLKSR